MCSGQSYGVKRVKAGRRGRKSCASCSADMVAGSWLGGCLLWGNRLKSGVDGGTVIELKFFYELDAVI